MEQMRPFLPPFSLFASASSISHIMLTPRMTASLPTAYRVYPLHDHKKRVARFSCLSLLNTSVLIHFFIFFLSPCNWVSFNLDMRKMADSHYLHTLQVENSKFSSRAPSRGSVTGGDIPPYPVRRRKPVGVES
ncbi:uncharacterized protein TrAFT101_000450 [Trichoderma asperellum]|uniref:uncharacterized protein n=1 Tax=Trichoderma asperellum TaxID=101201 RepID=UPI0033170FBC|nr:hypothetical protein TrAFT101_000450 [Trichoderma asperellum]